MGSLEILSIEVEVCPETIYVAETRSCFFLVPQVISALQACSWFMLGDSLYQELVGGLDSAEFLVSVLARVLIRMVLQSERSVPLLHLRKRRRLNESEYVVWRGHDDAERG